MRETWYKLEDGRVVDPAEVAPDESGLRLFHKSGVAVAMRGDVPHSVGVDPEQERAKIVVPSRDVQPERTKRPYNRRDMKAD